MSNQVLELPKLDKIELEASAWVEKLDRGLDELEYRAFKQWIDRSKRHYDSIVAMAELWDQLDIDAIISETEVISLSHLREDDDAGTPILSSLFASLVIVVGLFSAGLYFFQDMSRTVTGAVNAATAGENNLLTEVGEQKLYTLADGSQLYLNTSSEVTINYSQELRSIVLNRGELFVQVASENKRPMLVIVNDRMIRATGAAFNVRWLDSEKVALTVTEGKIAVSDRQQNDGVAREVLHEPITASFPVVSGQRVIIGVGQEQPYRIVSQALYALSFWRSGQLLLTGESLEYAVQEMARYTTKTFVLDDSVKRVRINGLFDVKNISAFTDALVQELQLDVHYSDANQIIISNPS